jgi:tetratricopeptide (TPR) repeat protein/tRNA A-37 threonylcarbamoyl transferase component Bud32
MIGRTIAHYHVIAKIGEGGMGVVYRAEDMRLRRTVALKFLRAQALGGRRERERFIREAQAAAALEHPNICAVHEIEEADGMTFIVMAYVEGKSLGEIVKAGPLPVEDSVCIAAQVAEGLREAHAHGIVHRDIKPGNIMIAGNNSARITDFGLARLAGAESVTRTRETVGTMYYMSPEQARGEPVDGRTDIWSLGVLLYQCLTGALPFTGEYDAAVLFRIVNEEPPAPSALEPTVPEELDRIVRRMLEKDPGKRYAEMGEVVRDLEHVSRSLEPAAEGSYSPKRGPLGMRFVTVSAAAAVIVVLAGVLLWPRIIGELTPDEAPSGRAGAGADSIISEAERLLSLAAATYPGGNPRQAIEYLEQAVERDSTLVGGFSRLARIYTYNRDYANAIYCADQVKQAAMRSGIAAEMLRADILENWVRGEWSLAVRNMRLYLRDFDPDDPQVRLELGYVLSRYRKEYSEAVAELKRFIEIAPAGNDRQRSFAFNYIGLAWLYAGEFDKALEAYARADELAPGSTDIEHSLAYVKQFRGEYADAIREYEILLHKDPRFYVTYEDLGNAYLETGRWRKALDSYSSYIDLTVPSAVPDGYILKGLVYLAQEDASRAQSMADSALARAQGSIRAHWLKGISMLRLGSDPEGAGEQLAVIDRLRERPGPSVDHAFFFHLEGMIDIERGDLEAGLEALRDAVEVSCRDDCIFFRQELVAGCLKAGRYDQAIREGEALLRFNPNNASVRYLLGLAYEAKGMLSTARDHYSRAAQVWSGGDAAFEPRRHMLERTERI